MDSIIIVTIIGTLLLIGIIAYFLVARLRKEAWEGELIEKREETSSSGEYEQTVYALYVKTADGARKRVLVRHKLYKELNPGDRLIKTKGDVYPRKT